MSKTSNRRGRKLSPEELDVLDAQRVAMPDMPPPPTAFHASYVISAAGRVYRDDDESPRLLLPCSTRTKSGGIKVNLNGGATSKSLPKMVYLAFGDVEPPDDVGTWDAWVDPNGPLDPLTGRLRCSVYDVVLVPHGDLIRFGRGAMRRMHRKYPILWSLQP